VRPLGLRVMPAPVLLVLLVVLLLPQGLRVALVVQPSRLPGWVLLGQNPERVQWLGA